MCIAQYMYYMRTCVYIVCWRSLYIDRKKKPLYMYLYVYGMLLVSTCITRIHACTCVHWRSPYRQKESEEKAFVLVHVWYVYQLIFLRSSIGITVHLQLKHELGYWLFCLVCGIGYHSGGCSYSSLAQFSKYAVDHFSYVLIAHDDDGIHDD